MTYNGETTAAINYNATTAAIQTALEGLSNVSSGDITVEGASLDQAGDTTFKFLTSAGDVGLISIDATSLTGPTTLSVSERTQGSDGWMHRNSNNIADAMTGITLNLKSTTEADSPIEVSISRDTSALRSKVLTLVNAYNGIVSFMDTNTEYNADTKKMGMLSNNIAVKYIENNVRNELIGIIDGFTDSIDSFTQISDIGLTINGEGKLELDVNDFDAAVEEDYKDVLELLGAMKTGNSSSNVVKFYQASDTYTEGGVYDVQVTVEDVEGSNVITAAKIKLASESTWHDATWSGNLVTGNSEFDDDGGGPLYAENSLQVTVDLTSTGTFDATVRVKQGFAGALEDLLKDTLASDGTIDNSKDILGIRIETMESTVEREQDRLDTINERLVAKFARMEKALTLLQEQSSTVSMLLSMSMGQS